MFQRVVSEVRGRRVGGRPAAVSSEPRVSQRFILVQSVDVAAELRERWHFAFISQQKINEMKASGFKSITL